jgi:hypothetical protein
MPPGPEVSNSANCSNRPFRVSPADDSACAGVSDPSVSTSRMSLS